MRVDVTESDFVFAVPGGLPHAVKEDALQLGPYRVTRGHFLLGDFQALLTGDAWDDGHLFRPERFLGAGGKRVERSEFLIPFSVGKRICPGEGLARDVFNSQVYLISNHILAGISSNLINFKN